LTIRFYDYFRTLITDSFIGGCLMEVQLYDNVDHTEPSFLQKALLNFKMVSIGPSLANSLNKP